MLLSSALPDLKISGQYPCLFTFFEKGIFSRQTEKSEKGDLDISPLVQITAVILNVACQVLGVSNKALQYTHN